MWNDFLHGNGMKKSSEKESKAKAGKVVGERRK